VAEPGSDVSRRFGFGHAVELCGDEREGGTQGFATGEGFDERCHRRGQLDELSS